MNSITHVNKTQTPSLFDDLVETLGTFSYDGLQYLRSHAHLLIKGVYKRQEDFSAEPLGCIFGLVSRGSKLEIDSKDALSEHFTGVRGPELRDTCPIYLAARRVVHGWDENRLEVDLLMQAVDYLIQRETSAPLSVETDNFDVKATMHVAWVRTISTPAPGGVETAENQEELALFN